MTPTPTLHAKDEAVIKEKKAPRAGTTPAEPITVASATQLRELTEQAHGANSDLGHALVHLLATVGSADIDVVKVFVYALLGAEYDSSPTEIGNAIARERGRFARLGLSSAGAEGRGPTQRPSHSIFDLGLRKGWYSSNPVKLADRPTLKKTETRIQFLEQAELEQLLAAPYPDDAFGRIEPTLYLTAAMTGVRQGELLGLRWRDARKVRVVSPYVRGEFGDPKSAGSGRSVPMAERVAVALRELRAQSVYSRDRDLVFCHPDTGKPLDRSKLVRRFKQAIDAFA